MTSKRLMQQDGVESLESDRVVVIIIRPIEIIHTPVLRFRRVQKKESTFLPSDAMR